MSYRYTPKPLVSQGGFTRAAWEINFKYAVYPGEEGEVDDVQVYSHRRGKYVQPSTRLYNAMYVCGCFDTAKACADVVWAGDCQDYYDGLGEFLRDQNMDREMGAAQ